MAKLNDKGYLQKQKTAITQAIKSEVAPFLEHHFEDKLKQSVDEDSNRLPEKAESTKKQYAKHGWDTKHWFVKTGESTKLVVKQISGGFKIFPKGKEILKNVRKAESWFTLSDSTKQKIFEIIRRKLS